MSKKIEEKYEFTKNGRTVFIYLRLKDYRMQFAECQFNFISPYSYDEWMFLKDVANEIERLQNLTPS